MRRARQHGFTLVEVMSALAILALGLTMLLRSTAKTVREAEASRMRGIAAALARNVLWDVEEQLRKDGFQETDQSSEGDFDDAGWPQIKWTAEVRKVELPSPEQLAAMAEAQAQEAAAAAAAEAGLGAGAGTGTGTASEPLMEGGGGLLGMLSMFGGGFTAEDVAGGNFLAGGGYTIIQDVFKVAIRKIVLTVSWKVLGQDESFVVVYYITDPDAMNRVLGGVGGADSGAYGQDVPPPDQRTR